MKNVDRWFILLGLLYGTFGFAFGIWVGINERFRAGASARPYQPDRLCLDGAVRAALPRLPGSCDEQIGGGAFHSLQSHIPLAQAHQTVALAAGGSLTVLAGMLTFLANYLVNAFSGSASVRART
jgi:hypothetical protein